LTMGSSMRWHVGPTPAICHWFPPAIAGKMSLRNRLAHFGLVSFPARERS
jgi:hypothetical protein